MALRWRKSFSILPGVRVNVSKSGVSTTVGPRGANINVGQKGTYLNTGLPGTGLGQRTQLGGNTTTPVKRNWLKIMIWINVIGWGSLFGLGSLFGWLTKGDKKWKHPVMIAGKGVNVRADANTEGKVVAVVSVGDTLELQWLNFHDDWCMVHPRADRGDFSPSDETGYVRRKFLTIPDSTLKRAGKGGLL